VRLQLKEVRQISDKVFDYVFQPDRKFKFIPGQFMEWTLADVPYDARGNRRTFTIASSPTETDIHLGLKFYEPASTYKAELERMQPGDVIYASQLAGNFTLNGNERRKLVFIAGGIGITPFRSMIKYATDKQMQVDITLIYVVGDSSEFAFKSELNEAAQVGVRTVPVVTDLTYSQPGVISAKLSSELIKNEVPDYGERIFYISGPNAMVDAAKEYLRSLGVSSSSIITDHFSGY
jgi:ferredoxin-NADP reductase